MNSFVKSSEDGGLEDTMATSFCSGTCGAGGTAMVASEIKAGNIFVIRS